MNENTYATFGRGENWKEGKVWVDFEMENVKVDCLVRKKREGKGKEGGKKTNGSHNFLS